MKLNRRAWIGLSIALATLVILSAIAAPSSHLRTGSTYGRAPDGYGAWFAYMQAQGTPIERWQRPFNDLLDPPDSTLPDATPISANAQHSDAQRSQVGAGNGSSLDNRPAEPMTLVGISPFVEQFLQPSEEWLQRGNVLVLVGVRSPVTGAPFRSILPTPQGAVTVETTRRQPTAPDLKARLSDGFGLVAWEQSVGAGKVIRIATPHLAANAYQDEPGNFRFLADLVTEPGHPVWVDEYIHGYQDSARDSAAAGAGRSPQSVWAYLSRTPIALLAVQSVVLLALAVWAGNHRMGKPLADLPPKLDNSEAYIQALGTVLRKAESTEFVVDTLSKAEQIQLQRSLGLGSTPIDLLTLSYAWEQQTGRPAAELRRLLNPERKKRLGDRALLEWVSRVQALSGE